MVKGPSKLNTPCSMHVLVNLSQVSTAPVGSWSQTQRLRRWMFWMFGQFRLRGI